MHEQHFSTAFTGQTPVINAHGIMTALCSFCKEATKRTKKRRTADKSFFTSFENGFQKYFFLLNFSPRFPA